MEVAQRLGGIEALRRGEMFRETSARVGILIGVEMRIRIGSGPYSILSYCILFCYSIVVDTVVT